MVKADDYVDVSVRQYALAEVDALAKEWADENEATNDARWIVSGFLAWLAHRERQQPANLLHFESERGNHE